MKHILLIVGSILLLETATFAQPDNRHEIVITFDVFSIQDVTFERGISVEYDYHFIAWNKDASTYIFLAHSLDAEHEMALAIGVVIPLVYNFACGFGPEISLSTGDISGGIALDYTLDLSSISISPGVGVSFNKDSFESLLYIALGYSF